MKKFIVLCVGLYQVGQLLFVAAVALLTLNLFMSCAAGLSVN